MADFHQPIRASLSFNVFEFLRYLPIITSHKQILDRTINDCPDLSDIQDLLEVQFLPQMKKI